MAMIRFIASSPFAKKICGVFCPATVNLVLTRCLMVGGTTGGDPPPLGATDASRDTPVPRLNVPDTRLLAVSGLSTPIAEGMRLELRPWCHPQRVSDVATLERNVTPTYRPVTR